MFIFTHTITTKNYLSSTGVDLKKIVFGLIISFLLTNCETDTNQPIHQPEYLERFHCNWIVVLDYWEQPIEYKCWATKQIYLEEYDISPQIANKIVITFKEDSREALVENPQGLEIVYNINDTSKVTYEKTYPKPFIK